MARTVSRIVSAWQLVAKRSLAHWRLLSSVVLGVLLASAIMAGTVIYFDALRELALESALDKHTQRDLDILVQGERGPTSYQEYERVSTIVTSEIDERIDWMLSDRIRAGKSPTFFLSKPRTLDQQFRSATIAGLERELRGAQGLDAEARQQIESQIDELEGLRVGQLLTDSRFSELREGYDFKESSGQDNARAYFAFVPRLPQHTTMVPGGTAPRAQRLNSPDEPLVLEVMIPRETSILFGVGVGDRLIAIPHWADVIPYVTVVISGIFNRDNFGDDIWHLEKSVLNAATGPSFRTAPFHITEKAYMEVLGASLHRMDSTYAWLLPVRTGRLNAGNADMALVSLGAMHSTLAANVSRYQQTTALDDALKEYDRRLFFSKLPMFVVLILIAVVILYYVVTLSSLAVEDRRGEVALLRSRGASSPQILAVFVLEGATIAAIAVLAGPIIAATAISLLGFTPAFSDLTGSGRLEANISASAYMMSALGGLFSFVALIIPAVQASQIGVTRHRQQSARPATQPAFQRYYVDVLLLLLGIFLFRQLREQGSVVATDLFGELAVDQLLLALPGLILIASAMVLLRLFPLIMNLGSRLMSPWLPAGLVMGVWQMARNPTHYARLSLLLILTAGLGIFASSFGTTLEASFRHRVLYATGSDIRVDEIRAVASGPRRFYSPSQDPESRSALVETYEAIPDVERASPVLRVAGQDLTKAFGQQYEMFAVDPESFLDVAWTRGDFSDKPMDSLLKSLKVPKLPQGIRLPDTSFTLGARVKADRPHSTVRVTARIRDAQGRYFTYTFGTLTTSAWTDMETSLRFGIRQSILTSRPLTLVSLAVNETGVTRRLQAGSILIDDIWVNRVGGKEIIEDFKDPTVWSVFKATPDAISDVLRASAVSSNGDSASALFSWTEGSPLTARGISHGPGLSALPVLASKSFIKATGHSRGEVFDVSAGGHRMSVEVVDTVDLFPTMTEPNASFLVADLTSLTRYANVAAITRELLSNGMWLSTKAEGVRRQELLQRLENRNPDPATSIHDRAERLEETKVDPLVEAGWRALLFIAFSAVLVLSCVGFLVHAYVSFRNRQLQFALLRTVGFSMRQLMTMVWLEHTIVIVAGLALGTWMGGRLGATIMPFLGHDDRGTQVVPPFVMQVNWAALLITYAVMLLVFAFISLGVIWLIHRISLQRILRLGEM